MATATTRKRHRITEYELKHYVEYFKKDGELDTFRGEVEIEERDPKFVEAPPCAKKWGYRFFDRTVAIVDKEKLMSDKKNYSNIEWLYPISAWTTEGLNSDLF